jgi:hypothetical protein
VTQRRTCIFEVDDEFVSAGLGGPLFSCSQGLEHSASLGIAGRIP